MAFEELVDNLRGSINNGFTIGMSNRDKIALAGLANFKARNIDPNDPFREQKITELLSSTARNIGTFGGSGRKAALYNNAAINSLTQGISMPNNMEGYFEGGAIPGPVNMNTGDDTVIKAKRGEYIVPADVVGFIGQEKLDSLVSKAKEKLAAKNPSKQSVPGFATGSLNKGTVGQKTAFGYNYTPTVQIPVAPQIPPEELRQRFNVPLTQNTFGLPVNEPEYGRISHGGNYPNVAIPRMTPRPNVVVVPSSPTTARTSQRSAGPSSAVAGVRIANPNVSAKPAIQPIDWNIQGLPNAQDIGVVMDDGRTYTPVYNVQDRERQYIGSPITSAQMGALERNWNIQNPDKATNMKDIEVIMGSVRGHADDQDKVLIEATRRGAINDARSMPMPTNPAALAAWMRERGALASGLNTYATEEERTKQLALDAAEKRKLDLAELNQYKIPGMRADAEYKREAMKETKRNNKFENRIKELETMFGPKKGKSGKTLTPKAIRDEMEALELSGDPEDKILSERLKKRYRAALKNFEDYE